MSNCVTHLFSCRYLTHPDDILTVVDAMKISIAAGYAPAYKQFGAELFQTTYPGCEIYVMWSDEYLACVARTYTSTIYHPGKVKGSSQKVHR